MESLALERPVISTYIAGIPELVDTTCGWIIPAGSKYHLRAAMQEALMATPEELQRKGVEGRRRILAEFELDQQAELLLSFIKVAVARAGVYPSTHAFAPQGAGKQKSLSNV